MGEFWDVIEETMGSLKAKLLIIDRDSDFANFAPNGTNSALLAYRTQRMVHQGVTTVLCTNNSKLWAKWRDIELLVLQEPIQQAIHLTTEGRDADNPIVRCRPAFGKSDIVFTPLPNCQATKCETDVWLALFKLGPASTEMITEKVNHKEEAVRNALKSLLNKSAIKRLSVDQNIWMVRLPDSIKEE
jgi:hypothetical protein